MSFRGTHVTHSRCLSVVLEIQVLPPSVLLEAGNTVQEETHEISSERDDCPEELSKREDNGGRGQEATSPSDDGASRTSHEEREAPPSEIRRKGPGQGGHRGKGLGRGLA